MDAQGVIESYVHDVARRLPRAKRDDVAFELRALLTDELLARAESEGREPDLELAMDMAIFQDAQTDLNLTRVFAMASALIWTLAAIELYREYIRVRPAPGLRPENGPTLPPENGLAT